MRTEEHFQVSTPHLYRGIYVLCGVSFRKCICIDYNISKGLVLLMVSEACYPMITYMGIFILFKEAVYPLRLDNSV